MLFLIDNSEVESKTAIKLSLDNVYIDYFHNISNIGYGAAHNIGIRKSIELGAKYHLILNPDVSFESYILDELKEYADKNDDVVYILPKVLYPNGEMQYLCKLLPTPFELIFRRFFPDIGVFKKINDKYTLRESGYDKLFNPPCLSGCFMFLRTNTLKDNSLFFDDRYFMYCEDFDLIRRMHRIGKTIYFPSVSIIHNHAKGSYKNKKLLFFHMRSAVLYFNKFGWFYDPERRLFNKQVLSELKGK